MKDENDDRLAKGETDGLADRLAKGESDGLEDSVG